MAWAAFQNDDVDEWADDATSFEIVEYVDGAGNVIRRTETAISRPRMMTFAEAISVGFSNMADAADDMAGTLTLMAEQAWSWEAEAREWSDKLNRAEWAEVQAVHDKRARMAIVRAPALEPRRWARLRL